MNQFKSYIAHLKWDNISDCDKEFYRVTKWVCQVYTKYQKQVYKWIRKEYLYCRPTALTNESLKPDLRKVASHIWENILSWVSKLVNQLEGKKKREMFPA